MNETNGGIHLDFDRAPSAAIAAVADGAGIVSELDRYLRRFAVLTPEQSCILAIYILHTHVIDACRFTPYIQIWSAVLRSGKTRVLELLQLFVCNPWKTERTSAAALIRKIAKARPTLLLDESDTAFSGDKEYSEALRGMLNAGFQKGGAATLCVKANGDWQAQDFPVFSAKVIAGIGMDKLPSTVRDRSIPIEMKRRAAGEHIEDFDTEDEIEATFPLVLRIEKWAEQNGSRVKGWAKPEKLTALSDRQRDICNPLLKVAAMIGEGWLRKLSDALVNVLGNREDDEAIGIQLLADIRCIFDEKEADRMFSADLVAELAKVETAPWSEWKSGKPMTPVQLARQLKSFKVCPTTVRIETAHAKGYRREDFADAWGRYVPPSISGLRTVTAETTRANTGEGHDFASRDVTDQVTDQKCVSINKDAVRNDVTDQNRGCKGGKFTCECGACFDTSAGYAHHTVYECNSPNIGHGGKQ